MAKTIKSKNIDDDSFMELLNALSSLRKEVKSIRGVILGDRKPAYTNTEVMDMFGIGTQTLKKWRDSGELPFSLVGSTYLYTKADVEKFLKNNHYDFSDRRRRSASAPEEVAVGA